MEVVEEVIGLGEIIGAGMLCFVKFFLSCRLMWMTGCYGFHMSLKSTMLSILILIYYQRITILSKRTQN